MLHEMTRPVQGGLRQEKKFAITANNIANANTTGFKKDVLTFGDMLETRMKTDFSEGPLQFTENRLDMAISGNGFFKIQTADGIRYTRSGNFTLDNTNTLVTQDGNPVLGTGGPIVIDGNDVVIEETGEVRVGDTTAGILAVVDFDSYENLKKDGNTLFAPADDTPLQEIAPDRVSVKQGALEMANITTVKEMAELIKTERLYQTYQKMMQTFDELNATAATKIAQFK
ncbi:MAG: flagellar hook-basal body protein [Thermodesulfobacteriota bacterium]|nr:flagellar hook-basal body protein [Thermodesulfobacteriota bacterium]